MNSVTKINLTNLKKCNQIWDEMPINEKGRLCQKCRNTIIDFRGLTDVQIAETHVYSEQKVCGLYSDNQLRISKTNNTLSQKKLNRWSSFYLGAIGILSLNSFGQEKKHIVKTEQTEKKHNSFNNYIQREVDSIKNTKIDSVYISGLLTDEVDFPIAGANVVIKGTNYGVSSDYAGLYKINITELYDSTKPITLVYSYIGYETIEIVLDYNLINNKGNRIINKKFEVGEVIEFYVIEKASFPKRVWYKVKNLFISK